jgi:RNA polymerase sigma-70 factor, ECF subfamily
MSSMHDDKAVVRRILQGDREAFAVIIERYQQPLLNYLGRMLGEREQALEFAQDVFLKAYASLGGYREEYKFSTWLFRIASNHMIDFWRKKKIAAVSLDRSFSEDGAPPQAADPGPSVIRSYELSELRKKIEKALRQIPESLRELFILRHVNEFSYEEIAGIKRLPVGTVKNRVFQAKEAVRALLEGER